MKNETIDARDNRIRNRIWRVRSSLATREVGMASLLLTMEVIIIPKSRCATAATDGKHLYVCADFIDSITSDADLVGLLMHEAFHVSMAHHLRRNKRNPRLWNIAADHVINTLLVKHGYSLPEGGCVDPRFAGMTTEQVYNIIAAEFQQKQEQKKQQRQQQQQQKADDEEQDEDADSSANTQSDDADGDGDDADGDGDGDGDDESLSTPSAGNNASEGEDDDADGEPNGTSNGDGENDEEDEEPLAAGEVWDAADDEGNPLTPEEIVHAEQELAEVLALAEQLEKACGKGAGTIRSIIDTNAAGKVEWLPVLRDFLTTAYRCDADDWNRPNRRHSWRGDYLPSRKRTVGGPLHVCIDTSGSVSGSEIQQFGEELVKIAEELNITEFIVAYVDSRTHVDPDTGEPWHRIDVQSGERIALKYKGGGGTEFDPVFNLVEYTNEQPVALVYFTDGEGSVSVKDPGYPVVWAVTGGGRPDFRREEFGIVVDVLLYD